MDINQNPCQSKKPAMIARQVVAVQEVLVAEPVGRDWRVNIG